MTFVACLLALVSLAQVLRRSQIALKDGPTDDLPEEGAEGTSKPEEKPTAKGKAKAKAKGRPRGKAKAAAATKCRQNMDDETSMAEVKNPGNEGVLDETSAMPGTDLEVDSKNAEIEADLAKPVEAHPDSGNGEKEEPAKRKRLRRVKTKDVESAGNEEAVEPKKKRKTAVGKNAVPEAAAGEDGASGAPEAKEAAKPIRKRRAAPKAGGDDGKNQEKKERKRQPNGEAATFARRPKPSSSMGVAKWLALRQVFGEIIRPKVRSPSTHEDLWAGLMGALYSSRFVLKFCSLF